MTTPLPAAPLAYPAPVAPATPKAHPPAESPIVILDSGVGGLSIARQIQRRLPQAPIAYVADFAALPYGEKSDDSLTAHIVALLTMVTARLRPRLIVIACNTASVVALHAVRQSLSVPIVGTVPAIKPAAQFSRNKVIGVLGTAATIRQPYVDALGKRYANDCVILRHAAGALVNVAEQKLRGATVASTAIEDAIVGLWRDHTGTAIPHSDTMDVIVLACTHFPLLTAELRSAARRVQNTTRGVSNKTSTRMPPRLRFIDGARGIAQRIVDVTVGQAWPNSAPIRRALITRRSARGGASLADTALAHAPIAVFAHLDIDKVDYIDDIAQT